MNQSALAQWKIPPLAAAAAAQPHYHNLFNWQASPSTAMFNVVDTEVVSEGS